MVKKAILKLKEKMWEFQLMMKKKSGRKCGRKERHFEYETHSGIFVELILWVLETTVGRKTEMFSDSLEVTA